MANAIGSSPVPEEKDVGDPSLPYKPFGAADPSIAEAAAMYGDIGTAEEYGYVHRG